MLHNTMLSKAMSYKVARSYHALVLLGLLFLGACTSTSSVVYVRDIDALDQQTPDASPSVTVPEQAKSSPIYQERAPRGLPIVTRLLAQADAALQAGQWEQAIALAEKGLGIERKEPRFYVVLAAAYSQLSNPQQSQSFAKQGLRYADKQSVVASQLESYLP